MAVGGKQRVGVFHQTGVLLQADRLAGIRVAARDHVALKPPSAHQCMQPSSSIHDAPFDLADRDGLGLGDDGGCSGEAERQGKGGQNRLHGLFEQGTHNRTSTGTGHY
jgi:hypothetical protein